MKNIAGIDYIGITTSFYCIAGGKLLLHKRSNNCRDEYGRWDNGGGQLEFGETLVSGVLREIKEELGCKAKIIEPQKIDDIGWFTLNNPPYPLHSELRRILSSDRIKYLQKYVTK